MGMTIQAVPTQIRHTRAHTSAPFSYDLRQDYAPYQTQVYSSLQRNFRNPLTSSLQTILDLRERTQGWDGYNAPPPNPYAIKSAYDAIQRLFIQVHNARAGWHDPYVSSDEKGNVTFDWRSNKRTLSLFVTPQNVEYLKVWGPDIYRDMADGDVTRTSQLYSLWHWLYK